jgi:arsenate reductase
MRDERPRVLFVCVHNAGRSQMAAALLERLAGDGVAVSSAGTQPIEEIHPAVAEVMRERGIDLGGRRPTRLRDESVRDADVVVTMGCGDECPFYPGTRYEDWDVPDPTGRPVEAVRDIADQIESRVRDLLDGLQVS